MKKTQEPRKWFQQLVPLEFQAGRVRGRGVTRTGSVESRRLGQGLETGFRWGKGEVGFFQATKPD